MIFSQVFEKSLFLSPISLVCNRLVHRMLTLTIRLNQTGKQVYLCFMINNSSFNVSVKQMRTRIVLHYDQAHHALSYFCAFNRKNTAVTLRSCDRRFIYPSFVISIKKGYRYLPWKEKRTLACVAKKHVNLHLKSST